MAAKVLAKVAAVATVAVVAEAKEDVMALATAMAAVVRSGLVALTTLRAKRRKFLAIRSKMHHR